jgi:hypothetical protein
MSTLRLTKRKEETKTVEVPTPPVWTQRQEDQRLRALAYKRDVEGTPFIRRKLKFDPNSSLRTKNGYAPAVTVIQKEASLLVGLLRKLFRRTNGI